LAVSASSAFRQFMGKDLKNVALDDPMIVISTRAPGKSAASLRACSGVRLSIALVSAGSSSPTAAGAPRATANATRANRK
jgi:hypothetical protein